MRLFAEGDLEFLGGTCADFSEVLPPRCLGRGWEAVRWRSGGDTGSWVYCLGTVPDIQVLCGCMTRSLPPPHDFVCQFTTPLAAFRRGTFGGTISQKREEHPAILITHPDICAQADVVNVLYCTTQRQNRPQAFPSA